MQITGEFITFIAQGLTFALILVHLLSVFLCLKSIADTNKRSLMGLIFMAPFMFDFGVMIYRIIALTIFGTSFDSMARNAYET